MCNSTTAASVRARELCRQFPDAGNLTLAKKLYKEFNTHYANLESARGAIRTIRGVNGEKHREAYKKKVPWTPGVAGQKPKLPPSQAEDWTPLKIDGPCRVVSISDAHIPYHDDGAVSAAVAYGKRLKPDVVIINGDWADFYAVSRWERHPARRDLKAELDQVKESLAWLRGQFRKARIIYKMGNHEERFDKYIWNKCVELWGMDALQLHNVLGLDEFGIERVNDEPILAGKLPILHGHELPRGISNPVSPARGAFLRALHSMLIGHHHKTGTYIESDIFDKEIACHSQGCLANLHPRWIRVPKWNHGFAMVDVATDGQYDLHNYRISRDYQVRAA